MGLGDLGGTMQLVGTLVGLYLLLLWAASVLWVYRDIRSRSTDTIAQAVGVAVVALMPMFGLALYLVLRPRETLDEAYEHELEREAIRSELHVLSPCSNCRRPVERDFVVCPYCRTTVREACGNCRELLAMDWRHCPYCGTSRAVREVARASARTSDGAERSQGRQGGSQRQAGDAPGRDDDRGGRPEIDDGPPPPRQRPARRPGDE